MPRKKHHHRSYWAESERTFGQWEKFVNGEVPVSDWVENVRMLRKSFAELHLFLEIQETKMREPISTEAQPVQNSSEAEL